MNKRPLLQYDSLQKYLLLNGVAEISYEEMLWTYEWIHFREEVKERDNQTCTICSKNQFKEMTDEEFSKTLSESGYGKYFNLLTGKYYDTPIVNEDNPIHAFVKETHYPSKFIFDKTVKLEVHHKYYILDKLPWEYELNVLTTLCSDCHESVHSQKPIVYVDSSLRNYKVLKDCNRCGGYGYINEYKHIQNGVCFNCGGLGGLLDGMTHYSIKIKHQKTAKFK